MRISLLACLPLFASCLFGCDGSSGDPCQVQSDCNSGLKCCGANIGGTKEARNIRGICASDCSSTIPDASATDAMSVNDTSVGAADAMMSTMDANTDATVDATVDAMVDGSADAQTDASADAQPDAQPDAAAMQ